MGEGAFFDMSSSLSSSTTQSVLNTAARLVYPLRRYDHITDALAVLHWLRLPQRVE